MIITSKQNTALRIDNTKLFDIKRYQDEINNKIESLDDKYSLLNDKLEKNEKFITDLDTRLTSQNIFDAVSREEIVELVKNVEETLQIMSLETPRITQELKNNQNEIKNRLDEIERKMNCTETPNLTIETRNLPERNKIPKIVYNKKI
jgi:hypothetical protein